MDSLTQIVLGASIAEYIGGEKLKNKAPIWGAILGTVPDLDVFLGPLIYSHPIQAELFHRGITHSLFFSIVAAPLLGYIITWIHHKAQEKEWKEKRRLRTRIAFFALTTHWMLDLFTGYGTQILLPFDTTSFAIDSIFIIDPLYTIPFLICLIMALWGTSTPAKKRKRIIRGLTLSSVYLFRSLGAKRWAHTTFSQSLHKQGIQIEHIYTGPELASTFLWRAWAEDEDYRYMGWKSIRTKQAIHWKRIPKNTSLLHMYYDDALLQQIITRRNNNIVVQEGSTPHELYIYPIQFGDMFGRTRPQTTFMFGYHIRQKEEKTVINMLPRGGDLPENRGWLRWQKIRYR